MDINDYPEVKKFVELKNKAIDEFSLKVKSCLSYQDQLNLPNFLVIIIRKYNKEWNETFKNNLSIKQNAFQELLARDIIKMNFPKKCKNAVYYLLPKEERK